MIKPLLISLLMLFILYGQSQILTINPTIINTINTNLLTQEAELYQGNIVINIPGGNSSRIQFFATLIKNTVNCSYSRCFSGWVNNYTIDGQTVVGYGNQTLAIQPVFQFKTNSQTDYIIIRNPKLAQTWVQIIEILCEKVNPQIASKTATTTQKLSTAENLSFQSYTPTSFSATIATDPATSNTATPPQSEVIVPKYSFQTISDADIRNAQTLKVNTLTFGQNVFDIRSLGLVAGDRVASLSEAVPLSGFKAPTSTLSENIVLNSENLVKRRAVSYELRLLTDLESTSTGQKAPDFNGFINLNFNYIGKTRVPLESARSVSNLLADAVNRQTYSSSNIEQRRAAPNSVFYPLQRSVQSFPKPEDADILVGNNQKLLSFNIVDQLNKVQTVQSLIDTTAISQTIKIDSSVLRTIGSLDGNARLLQALQNYTIYNYKKVLFSKTIFGKGFETNVEVKCYLLVFSNDHQVQCTGAINYILFGNAKSIQVFNFIKSIHLTWNFNKTFSGSWPFSIYIPLPPPVSFMGINFSFKVSYQIKINIAVTTTGADPLVYKCATLVTTKVDTTASAALRVVAIQGGVYITGTLVSAGTDPTVTLSYYIKQKYIKVLAQWYFWIQAFKYEWGFFYRYWTFWSGWSGQKKIASWTINGVYGKWAIVNKSWYIYL